MTNESTGPCENATNEPTDAYLRDRKVLKRSRIRRSKIKSRIKNNELRPTVACEIVTNEPTDARENTTNEPTAGYGNPPNEPTASPENATNEPSFAAIGKVGHGVGMTLGMSEETIAFGLSSVAVAPDGRLRPTSVRT